MPEPMRTHLQLAKKIRFALRTSEKLAKLQRVADRKIARILIAEKSHRTRDA